MSKQPTGSSHLSFTMAAVMAGGGIFGYMKAKSVPSLVGGVALGAVYVGSGVLINQDRHLQGHSVALAASVVAAGIMASRVWKTRAVMPGAPVAVLATLAAVYNARKVSEWQ